MRKFVFVLDAAGATLIMPISLASAQVHSPTRAYVSRNPL
jgi:hypothetical protein